MVWPNGSCGNLLIAKVPQAFCSNLLVHKYGFVKVTQVPLWTRIPSQCPHLQSIVKSYPDPRFMSLTELGISADT